MNPTFKYQQGNFRMVSNNYYSPGMMPPPRPNAHYYTMYNHHQYLEQPRGSFMPPVLATNLVSNSRNMQRHFPVERNRFPNVGPQPMQGCSNTNIVKNATVTPERSIVQLQQPMQVEESVRENSIVKNQHRPPNDAVMDDNQTTNTKTDGHKTQTTTNFDFKVYGTSDRERTFMLTGTVDRIIKWGKIFQNQHCCSEVIGSFYIYYTG
ncbi:unnamed protein product [Acanthoscelides obtectus]|uniref:Uncharacterized protein n=1 Tax=Acanthoscelides obtectus TaxID=200917 RepID=A0A9P0L4E0_ACAOB|nr:unnamed protein product [Acanthoscelides obtectus]CAK1626464.1 hypothetical protein AOBTE_LOCUS3857 [Acanthoscelides obtectus]